MSQSNSCFHAIRSGLFENRTKEEVISLVNTLFQTDFPLDSDILVQVQDERTLMTGLMALAYEAFSPDKVMIVFCSTKQKKSKCEGLRLFVKLKANSVGADGKQVIAFPEGRTLYAHSSLPKEGEDALKLAFEPAAGTKKRFNEKQMAELMISYVNLLAMEESDFENSPWSPLKSVYDTFK